ncbi:hypothetical protein ACLOJK_027250 [Asimina triloba]
MDDMVLAAISQGWICGGRLRPCYAPWIHLLPLFWIYVFICTSSRLPFRAPSRIRVHPQIWILGHRRSCSLPDVMDYCLMVWGACSDESGLHADGSGSEMDGGTTAHLASCWIE